MATVNGAHNDGVNQQFSSLGVIGTLGTADVGGTAKTISFSADPSTGAQYVYNLGPAGSVSVGDTPGGTLDFIGSIATIGTLPAISLAIDSGTLSTLGTVGSVATIGTVNNVIPGTGVANLGKQYASAAGSVDVGVAVFAKVLANDSHDSNNADNQYGRLSITNFRELRTRDQRAIDLANCNVAAEYTALSNDTTGIAISNNHVFGTAALTFDKVNGTANTVYAGVSKDLGTINVQEIFEAGGFVGVGAYIPDLTNIVNVFLRIGDDSTNYNCWTWPVANLTASSWLNLRMAAASPDATRNAGNGWNTAALKYVAFGAEFLTESDTLAGLIFDHVHIVGGRVTASDINAAITSSVTTPNINVQRVGGVATSTNNGVVGGGVQRVTIASNSTGSLSGIGVVGTTTGIGVVSVLTKGTISAGTVEVSTGTIVSVGTVPGIGSVTNMGTLSAVSSLKTVEAGTLNTLGTIGTVVGVGTISNIVTTSGTVTGIGTISNVVTTSGTVTGVGTITNIGTIGTIVGMPASTLALNSGTITTGSLADIAYIHEIGTMPAIVIGESTGGTLDLLAGVGTIGSITDIAKIHSAGTIVTGSLANIAMLHAGTIASVGTVPGIGSITNIGTIGTIEGMPAATLALDSGTITTITAGTQNTLGTVAVVNNIVTGTIANSGTTTGVGVVTSVTDVANLAKGTVTSVGTVVGIGTVSNVVTTSGTVTGVGVVSSVSNLVSGTLLNSGTTTGVGTITNLGSITNIGSIAAGVLTSVGTNVGVGVVTSVTNVANLAKGTVTVVGSTTGMGVLTNLTSGSVRMTIGTITTGSITNVALVGSITNIGSIAAGVLTSSGTTTGVGTLSNVGSVNTITSVSNIVTGTLSSVTLNNKPLNQILTVSALGTAGGSLFATLSAASGAGTTHYVSGLQIVVSSGTPDIYVGFGTVLTGGSVLARGAFPPGGGIMRDFTFPVQSGTNSEICYEFAGAGTAFIAVNYWKGA